MNCSTIHRRLLALERLDSPPAEVSRHLAVCAACRSTLKHLSRIERDVPNLPVPAPIRKDAFLAELANEISLPRLHHPVPRRERGLRKMALAVALAASLLFIAVGALVWNLEDRGGPRVDKPSAQRSDLEKRLDADVRWENARTPTERVRILDDLAKEVEDKAMTLAQRETPHDLDAEVKLYRQVIDALTDREAPGMTNAERRTVLLPIANRLTTLQSEATRLARTEPRSASSLRVLAEVASDGDRKLRALML